MSSQQQNTDKKMQEVYQKSLQSLRLSEESQRKNLKVTLTQQDLERLNVQFDSIKEIYKGSNQKNDLTLQSLFEEHVKNVTKDLQLRMKQRCPDIIASSNVLKAKYALQEICFVQMIEYVKDQNEEVGQVLENIHDEHAQIFKDLTGMIQSTQDSNTPDFNQQFILMKSEIERYLQEIQEQRNQITLLEKENKRYLEMIIKYSKGDKAVFYKQGSIVEGIQHQDSFGNLNPEPKRNQSLSPQPRTQVSQRRNSGQQVVDQNDNLILPSRNLTLKQTKDMIFEIYDSKDKYDQRCSEIRIPKETMEQHMYNFFNQKYGLKPLIIEWASAIINAVKKYCQEDNDVAVFGKILRNECDEDFRSVQSQVKNTIQELLKMYLKVKNPLKTGQEIKDMLQQKILGWVWQDEAYDIIRYMYNQEDSESLIQRIQGNFVTLKSIPTIDSQIGYFHYKKKSKRLTREELNLLQQERNKPRMEYWLFQKFILDFQLKSHEKYLKRYIQIFKNVDQDQDGIINEIEFKKIILMLNIDVSEQVQTHYLNCVDPYSHQQITFSQTVQLFSQVFLYEFLCYQEQIQFGKSQISIIQKINIDF